MSTPTTPSAPQKNAQLPKLKSAPKDARRLARLASVQVLYIADMLGAPAKAALAEFAKHHLEQNGTQFMMTDDEATQLGAVDMALLSSIVENALASRDNLSELIRAQLPAEWKLERLERPLLLMLLAGAGEIVHNPQTPTAVIVSDYIDVAHAYYGGKEPGMLNALLDKIAKAVRP